MKRCPCGNKFEAQNSHDCCASCKEIERSPRRVLAKQVQRAVTANPQLSINVVAERLGVDAVTVTKICRELGIEREEASWLE